LEANQLRDSWNEIQQLGIEVLGVSYDTPEKNRIFAEMNELPFRLLSDRDHELAKSVGAARALIPFAKRISYLVGPDGRVLVAYPDVKPSTHAQEVLQDYRAIVANAE
jgi:peroxiredoxin Q/BCP